jgi:hypothetical protein
MNIYDYEDTLKRNPGSRFTDNQLNLVGDLNASGYTFDHIADFMSCEGGNLNAAYLKYRARTEGDKHLSHSERLIDGVGPWYAQSKHYSGKPVDNMGAL